MRRMAVRLITLASFSFVAAFAAVPITIPSLGQAWAAGGDDPSPPATDSGTKGKKKKSSSRDDDRFLQGYRTAYAAIYDRGELSSAIDQLKALGQDDRADVANLIGYSYRKLGNYQLAQAWYERALKADPDHVRTWQYYGLWQLEQGRRDQAQYHLGRIRELCGTDCDDYRSLAAALEQPPGAGLVCRPT